MNLFCDRKNNERKKEKTPLQKRKHTHFWRTSEIWKYDGSLQDYIISNLDLKCQTNFDLVTNASITINDSGAEGKQ